MRAVLTYHSLDDSGSPVSIPPDVFRRHVRWLASGPVDVVPLSRLLEVPPEADAVAITFDDGFRNFLEDGWPVLRNHGLPVTLFVVTGHAGGRNDWEETGKRASVPDLPLLGWDEVARLAEEGVDLGSHTRTHPDLAAVQAGRLAGEIEGSAADLEECTGRRPLAFAYPYGRVGAAAEAVVRRTYDLACTTRLRELPHDAPRHRLPRLDAHYFRDPARLAAWGSTRFRSRLRLREGGRRLRRMLAGGRT